MRMTLEEMKNDANWPEFAKVPSPLFQYAQERACNRNQFVSWLYVLGNEVYIRTFAYKETKARGFEFTEVERKGTPEEWAIQKNMWFANIGGWQVVYKKPIGDITSGSWSCSVFWESNFDKWSTEKPIGVYSKILNLDDLFQAEAFRFCGYKAGEPLLEYLRAYKQNPQVEYFGKLGIHYSKALLNKAQKDRRFIKFLQQEEDAKHYGPKAVIFAYDHKMTLPEAEKHLYRLGQANRRLSRLHNKSKIKPDVIRLIEYIDSRKIPVATYEDYWEACVELGLDMKDTKNLYPQDFQRMHDLRADQYDSLKDRRDRKQKRKLYEDFKKQANAWKPYEVHGEIFSILIPGNIRDLKREGNRLHHCVGKMGYDKKMAEGRSLIAFLRKAEDESTPFVTIEYIPSQKRIQQIYGDHDSKPAPEVVEFANEWAQTLAAAE